MNATENEQSNRDEQSTDETTLEVESFGKATIRIEKNLTITSAAEHAGVCLDYEDEDQGSDGIPISVAAARFNTSAGGGWVGLEIERNPDADGRRSDMSRPIKQAGGDPPQHTFRLTLPDEALTALDIDPDDAIGETLEVKAGDGLVLLGKPQSDTITVIESNSDTTTALSLLGPKATDYFRAVELERRHPMVVAIEEGVTTQHVIHTVREARSRLRELVDQGHHVDYDFDSPNVPDSTEDTRPIRIDADLPTTDMTDSELREAVSSTFTTQIDQQTGDEIMEAIMDTAGDATTDGNENSQLPVEDYINTASRDELDEMYIRLSVAQDDTSGVDSGGGLSEH